MSHPPDAAGIVPPPPAPDTVWSEDSSRRVFYLVRHPWRWVMEELKHNGMQSVDTASELPSYATLAAAMALATPGGAGGATPASARRRRISRKDRSILPATLKLEFVDAQTNEVIQAIHGTSASMDGLEDKDELVRTLQRCRCEHLALSPPSVLINWDVTHEECLNVVGANLPALESNKDTTTVAVLKEPMGSQGKGIYFVSNVEEIHEVINEHRQRAQEEPALLENLIEAKGRIPSWGKFCLLRTPADIFYWFERI
jgi:hypothetical protein